MPFALELDWEARRTAFFWVCGIGHHVLCQLSWDLHIYDVDWEWENFSELQPSILWAAVPFPEAQQFLSICFIIKRHDYSYYDRSTLSHVSNGQEDIAKHLRNSGPINTPPHIFRPSQQRFHLLRIYLHVFIKHFHCKTKNNAVPWIFRETSGTLPFWSTSVVTLWTESEFRWIVVSEPWKLFCWSFDAFLWRTSKLFSISL